MKAAVGGAWPDGRRAVRRERWDTEWGAEKERKTRENEQLLTGGENGVDDGGDLRLGEREGEKSSEWMLTIYKEGEEENETKKR